MQKILPLSSAQTSILKPAPNILRKFPALIRPGMASFHKPGTMEKAEPALRERLINSSILSLASLCNNMADPDRFPDAEGEEQSNEEEILETGQSEAEIKQALQEARETGREVMLLHVTSKEQRVANDALVLGFSEDGKLVGVDSMGYPLWVEIDSIKGVIPK